MNFNIKYIFIINPVAGKKDTTETIKSTLVSLKEKYEELKYDIYLTKEVGDATRFVTETIQNNQSNEELCFVACGGDGTINEVANGVKGTTSSFSCYPCGSGNDFVKAFRGKDFKDIEKIILGEKKNIDLIKTNGRYCINITNIGFDAATAYYMALFKHWPLVTGKGAYKLGLMKALFKDMKHYADIYVDDKKIELEGFLLACACNGICCGGSYYCSIKSYVDDGILDVIAIKHMSVFKFLKLVKYYQNGTYQDNPKILPLVSIHKAKKLHIVSKKGDIIYGLDGESFKDKEITVELQEDAVSIVVPID